MHIFILIKLQRLIKIQLILISKSYLTFSHESALSNNDYFRIWNVLIFVLFVWIIFQIKMGKFWKKR